MRRHRELTVREAGEVCQQSAGDARAILEALRARQLVERRGEGRGRKYVLGPVAYEALGIASDRPLDLGMTERTFEGLLLDELDLVGAAGRTAGQIRAWSRYGKAQTTRLLRQLCEKEVVVSSG